MSEQFKTIENQHDVVKFIEQRPHNIIPESMFEIEDLERIFESKLIGISPEQWDNDSYNDRKKYVNEGLEAKYLNLNLGKWQKGKVRIKVYLEFCPDEDSIESPLDDFRNK